MVERPPIEDPRAARATWFVLTNHGSVLLCVARDPTIRISEIARRVGIGERAAQKIVADLVAEGPRGAAEASNKRDDRGTDGPSSTRFARMGTR